MLRFIAAGVFALSFLTQPSAVPRAETPEPRECRLRSYIINRGQLDNFASAWLKGVRPLRLQAGFTIPAAWKGEGGRFMWILCYAGPEKWEEKDAAYYASAQRKALEPDPAQWVAHAEEIKINSVLDPAKEN